MTVGVRIPRALRARSWQSGLAAAVVAAVLTGTAAAQTLDPATVTVSDFGPVVLDGTPRSTTATMSDFTVTESAGTGWHVTIQATQFAEVDATGQYVAGGKTLPTGSLAMPAPGISPTAGATVTAGPYLIDGANVKIVTVAAGNPGTFTLTQSGPLTLSVPTSAYARSYRSEVTVGLHSGP